MKAYLDLEKRFARLTHVDGAAAMLGWDSAVMMPKGGATVRAEEIATLKCIAHEILVAKEVGEMLQEAAEAVSLLNPWQAANLREMQREWRHATAVDASLVEAMSKASSESEMVWREARKANDFKRFAPYLKKVVSVIREIAKSKAAALGCLPYDALLDYYDPGRKSAGIDMIFKRLEQFLPGFIQEVLEKQRSKPPLLRLPGPFPIHAQKEIGMKALEALGFDFNHGRLDISHHPFCGGVPSDIRITTRYYEDDFLPSLMGVIHETGHALYENHLPADWRDQPVGKARGMSIHESQSLLMEMQACRSKDFLIFIQPIIVEAFKGEGPLWEVENLYRIITKVTPSLIRVDADEVTYPAHIILRYGLEKAMIAGELEVDDLPIAWNEGMQKLLGITPDTDKNGCMQDIHWPGGDFGYFPTYTLGAMIAAQLFAEAKKQVPYLAEHIRKGDFSPLVAWLSAHVHAFGSFYETDALLIESTGKALDVDIYINHLQHRYL